MGDEVLNAFARRLEECVRSVDTVARLGGDEFAIVLEQLSDRDAGCRIAGKIVTSMRPEFTLEYRTLAITTSIGVAFHQGGEEINADDLVKKADQALYAAKGAGRNNYQVAE
jgi:diguanylate cyclase (GGDEF)-like protein